MNRWRFLQGMPPFPAPLFPLCRPRSRGKKSFLFFSFLLASLMVHALPTLAAGPVTATLKNGLRVVIVPNALARAVAVQVNYQVGSDETPPGFPGMAHAQEHMMFRGTPELSAAQLSTITAALGGEFNANTQQTVTQYVSTVAVEDLETVLHLEAARMRGVLDDQEAWNQERGGIIQEVEQDLSDPEYLLVTRILERLFAGTPYAHDALGTRDSFQKTTGAMLREFYRRWYAPNNAVLVVVGDLDPERTLATVRNLFETRPARQVPGRAAVKLEPLRPAFVSLESDLPYGIAVVAYRFPGFESADYAAGQVLADLLDSKRGDLYALVPDGKALSAEFESMALPKGAVGFAMVGFAREDAGRGLIDAVKGTVGSYLKKGFPADLVEAAKRREIADEEFRKNSLEGLATVWSQAVAVEGRRSPQDDVEAIKRVTVEDVNRVARRYLVNKTAVTALLVPRPSGKPETAKANPRGKESFTPQQVKPAELPPWARRLTKTLPEQPKEENPAEFRLANGLRLLVVPTAVSDTVGVYGRVKNEPALETPQGKEGVDDLLGDLFPYGSTTLDRLHFQEALDEIAADVEVGNAFSLRVLKRHVDRGVALLADNLLHPALPEEAFKVVRQQNAEAVAGKLQSAEWLTHHALREALYPKKDPALRHPTPQTVQSLTLKDVREYYRTAFRPDLTTVVVIGAITPLEAKALMEKYFGGWRGEGETPATDLPEVPLNAPSAVVVPDASRSQDEVTLEQTLGLTRAHPDYYPLQVGLHVLTGAFYATRFYRDLRERTGLVYAVEADLHLGKTRSTLGVLYGCDPENVGKARLMIERDLNEMQEHPVTETELMQAKTLLLRRILLDRTGTEGIAAELLHLSLLDLPLDEAVRAAERFRATDADEVRGAFRRWIRPEGFAQVTRGPNPR